MKNRARDFLVGLVALLLVVATASYTLGPPSKDTNEEWQTYDQMISDEIIQWATPVVDPN